MGWHRRIIFLVVALTVAVSPFIFSYSGQSLHPIPEMARSYLARAMPAKGDALRGLSPEPFAGRLKATGFEIGQPVLLRLFKEESLLELWMERDGRFQLAETFPICAWSGRLGPKLREGDGQTPEGYYLASRRQLKPDSTYYRAINIGFPNVFDQQQGRTGSFLMIHGNCVSIGCFAMTDAGIADIYAAVEAALASGQQAISIQAFPFRLTVENLERHRSAPWSAFWRNLAAGERIFLETGQPPGVLACGDRYVFAEPGSTTAAEPSCARLTAW